MSQRDSRAENIYDPNIYKSNEFITKFIERYMEFYEEGMFDILELGWKYLGEDARLKVLEKAYKESNNRFICKEHFEMFPSDMATLNGKLSEYAIIYAMLAYEQKELLSFFSGDAYQRGKCVGEIALYSRFKDYLELSQSQDALTLDMLIENHRFFKCDASRTAARLKFLQEFDPEVLNDKEKLTKVLLCYSDDFNRKYQKQLEDKISTLDAATYKAAVILASKNGRREFNEDEMQYFQYDKFLEFALKVAYGDKGLSRRIEKVKKEFPADVKLERRVKNAEDISIIELFDVLPKAESDEGYTRGSGNANTRRSSGKKVDKEKIVEYIKTLKKQGIECKCAAISEGGTKLPGEKYVTYYVFEAGEYRVLEALGQPGNATLVIRAGDEDLKKLLRENTRDELVTDGRAFRVRHSESDEYVFSPMRIKNIITLINETVKREIGESNLTIDELITQVTEIIPKDELRDATQYVDTISRQTAYSYITKTAHIERKNNPKAVNPSLKRQRGRPKERQEKGPGAGGGE